MAKLKIAGLSDELDGEYEFVVPTTGDQRYFRVSAGIDPDEMTKILAAGSAEAGALVIFSAIRRTGKLSDAPADSWKRDDAVKQIMELPMDQLAAALGVLDGEAVEDDAVPPVSEPASNGGQNENDDSSGSDSPPSSEEQA